MTTYSAGRHHRDFMKMVQRVIRIANEPARRFRLLWNLVGAGVAGLYVMLGAGYAVGGQGASASKTLQLLINIEGGSYRVHGFIMMILALFLAYGLGPLYRWGTRLALQLVTLYSLIVAAMIFGGWAVYDVSFGAPWWYLFTAFLSIVLMVLAPPLIPASAIDAVVLDDDDGGESA